MNTDKNLERKIIRSLRVKSNMARSRKRNGSLQKIKFAQSRLNLEIGIKDFARAITEHLVEIRKKKILKRK